MDAVFQTHKGIFNYRVAGIWIKKDHVLLHRDVNDNRWALPGGRVGMMEEAATAVVREFREELGAAVQAERLVWSTENFFTFAGNNYHEIGFYYKVISTDKHGFNQKDFFGMEGNRLIYRWTPMPSLNDVALYPGFLKEGLRNLPNYSQHMVIRDIT